MSVNEGSSGAPGSLHKYVDLDVHLLSTHPIGDSRTSFCGHVVLKVAFSHPWCNCRSSLGDWGRILETCVHAVFAPRMRKSCFFSSLVQLSIFSWRLGKNSGDVCPSSVCMADVKSGDVSGVVEDIYVGKEYYIIMLLFLPSIFL